MEEQQQFLLKWHYQETTLLKNLPHMLDADVLTDITLSTGSNCVRAHRLVLATCSPYFFHLFQTLNSANNAILILHNVNFKDLQAILCFVYKGHCFVTRDQMPGLLSLAKVLQIQGLCDMQVPELHSKPETELDDKAPSEGAPEPGGQGPKRPPKESGYRCFLCSKYLSNQYNLRVHMETHREGYHACNSCSHISKSKDALRKHVSYRHPQDCLVIKKKKKTDSDLP